MDSPEFNLDTSERGVILTLIKRIQSQKDAFVSNCDRKIAMLQEIVSSSPQPLGGILAGIKLPAGPTTYRAKIETETWDEYTLDIARYITATKNFRSLDLMKEAVAANKNDEPEKVKKAIRKSLSNLTVKGKLKVIKGKSKSDGNEYLIV